MKKLLPTIGMLILSLQCIMANTIPESGLLLWLDTEDGPRIQVEGDRVTRWSSRVPGGPVFTSEGAQRPRWMARPERTALPGVVFDGINDVLIDPSFNESAETWTLIIRATPYGPSPEGGAFCSAIPAGGDDYDPGFTVDTYQSSPKHFDQISVEGAGRIGGQKDQLRREFDYNTPHLLIVERDETEVRLYVDGDIEEARPVSPAETKMAELRLGARFYGGRERAYFKGELHTVLLYDRILTSEERDAVERAYFVSSTVREAFAREFAPPPPGPRMAAPVETASWPDVASFWKARPGEILAAYPRPEDLPLRTDLKEAIALSMTHLVSLFDADRDDEPFFFSNHRVDGTGEMHHSVNIGIPHVVGRCLLGEVVALQATGLPIDPEGLATLRRYCKVSFDNPYGLNSYTDPEKNNEQFVEFHNVREGLYSLWALIAYDNDPWARETAAAMVQKLNDITDEHGTWSPALIDATTMKGHYSGVAIPNAARAVEPLLALHRATGDATALRLAGAYARSGIATLFDADGHFTEWTRSSGHVHSITSALAGITEFAILSKDQAMIEQCRRVMEIGVPEFHSSWGWGDEVFPEHPADVVGRGEINQTGDVVRTALMLGAAGYPEYYGLAERYLRSMLLPTQHREAELRAFMRDNENPARDAEFNVIRRTVGGFAMQLPNDRMREGDWPLSTLDITSGAVHAMAACYAHAVTGGGERIQVNLLFDYQDERITIESALPQEGGVTLTVKNKGNLRVRVPGWLDVTSLQATRNEAAAEPQLADGYLAFDGLQSGDIVALRFPVACRSEKEIVDSTEYTTYWMGEQLVAIQPRGAVSPLPF